MTIAANTHTALNKKQQHSNNNNNNNNNNNRLQRTHSIGKDYLERGDGGDLDKGKLAGLVGKLLALLLQAELGHIARQRPRLHKLSPPVRELGW